MHCPESKHPLGDQFEDFTDAVDLIRQSGANSVGYIVTDDTHHGLVMDSLTAALSDRPLEVISGSDPDETLNALTTLLNRGRAGSTGESGSTILDVSGIDYADTGNEPTISKILMSLNVGRTLLINSAELTVIVAPAAHFDLYQQQPDLYGTRAFVTRVPSPEI